MAANRFRLGSRNKGLHPGLRQTGIPRLRTVGWTQLFAGVAAASGQDGDEDTHMRRIYSNDPQIDSDYIINPFHMLSSTSSRLHLAAPYFTYATPILGAVRGGKPVQLIVGLNTATSPNALRALHRKPGVEIRYFTDRFHAKIYLFDDGAILGSSNLTDGGLLSNREAVIVLDRPENAAAVEELRGLFAGLWEAAHVLSDEKLETFAEMRRSLPRPFPDPDREIEKALGKAEPPNVRVASRKRSRKHIFLETLRRRVQQYRPAFNEVTDILQGHGFRREELVDLGTANETNRFLNYVRKVHAVGDEAWQTAEILLPEGRRAAIVRLGREWASAADSKVPEDYASWLQNVHRVFGTAGSLDAATKDAITAGLMSLHAFNEQFRFVKGGTKNLPGTFWKENRDDIAKVKATLSHLLYGDGDFVERLHDVLYDASSKLHLFGQFCGLELYGTVKPEEYPPINGRMAKALRYLGYGVEGI